MKALVLSEGRLEFHGDYPAPKAKDGEAIVKVLRAGICATNLELEAGYMDFDGVPGHEFCGTVVAGSKQLRGKRVVADINCICKHCDMCLSGLGNHCRNRTVVGIVGRDGAMAEYVAIPEENCYPVPDNVPDENAVFAEPLAAAYQVVKQVPIDSTTRVTVLGSGRLGLLIAQVLAATGCKLVVAGRNPRTLQFCERWRINTAHVDDLRPVFDRDVVVEATGSMAGLQTAMQLVRPHGTLVLKSTVAEGVPLNLTPLVVNEVTVIGSRCGPLAEAIATLAADRIDVSSMISRTYPLEEGPAAFAAATAPENIKILLDPTS